MNGTTLIIMGVAGIFCCPILAPVTWVMSNNAMSSGTLTADEASKINIARIIGIVGSVLLILSCLWGILGGGFAAIQGVAGAGAAGAGAGVR